MRCVFLHGLGQTACSWYKTVSCLMNVESVSCPELADFLAGNGSTYSGLYNGVSDCCGETGEPISLCGLSLGAVLALNYTIDNPKKVESLVLIGAQYKMPKLLLRLQNAVFRLMPGGAFKKMGFCKEDILCLTGSMMNLDFTESLKDISCPVLVVCGERDGANKRAAESLTKLIPNADFKVIAGAGHEVNIDNPSGLAEAINNFLI